MIFSQLSEQFGRLKTRFVNLSHNQIIRVKYQHRSWPHTWSLRTEDPPAVWARPGSPSGREGFGGWEQVLRWARMQVWGLMQSWWVLMALKQQESWYRSREGTCESGWNVHFCQPRRPDCWTWFNSFLPDIPALFCQSPRCRSPRLWAHSRLIINKWSTAASEANTSCFSVVNPSVSSAASLPPCPVYLEASRAPRFCCVLEHGQLAGQRSRKSCKFRRSHLLSGSEVKSASFLPVKMAAWRSGGVFWTDSWNTKRLFMQHTQSRLIPLYISQLMEQQAFSNRRRFSRQI